MKRYKKLLILLAVLIVAVGGYFIIKSVTDKNDSADGITLYSEEKDNITSVTITKGSDSVTLEKDSDGNFNVSGESDFEIDSDKTAVIFETLASLKAKQKISDDIADASKYGLDSPALALDIKTSDNNDKTLKFGNLNENTSMYYFSISGDNSLYYAESTVFDSLNADRLTLVKRDTISDINSDDVKSVDIKNGDFSASLTLIKEEKESESYDISYESADKKENFTSDKVNDKIKNLTSLDTSDLVCYKPTADELGNYGLSSPYGDYKISYTKEDEDKTFEVLVSKADSDGNVYFMLAGGSKIYKVSSESIGFYSVNSYSDLK